MICNVGAALLQSSSSMTTINSVDICEAFKGLTKKQIQICKRNVDLMESVETALKECQRQLRDRRWNCSSLEGSKAFGKSLTEGTRESAFVHAITSAGVSYAVTKACSSGTLLRCGCDRTFFGPANGFHWAGCSDNIAFGTAFSKTFIDARDLRTTRSKRNTMVGARALMNLHNNEAGRKVVLNNMRIDCKCHGVSGSCDMKTCWRVLPSFKQVGLILRQKFDSATEVHIQTLLNALQPSPTIQKIDAQPEIRAKKSSHKKRSRKIKLSNRQNGSGYKPPSDSDLVYLHSSPDYCERDEKSGSPGTHDRFCNGTSKGADGCDILCCNRGFTRRFETVKEKCNCKFFWCCQVECDECTHQIEINTCL
uniref:Protein Wnt n=1 Tax=Tetranychus urticae TaxID=32264 RepID=T1K7I4_TETUR